MPVNTIGKLGNPSDTHYSLTAVSAQSCQHAKKAVGWNYPAALQAS